MPFVPIDARCHRHRRRFRRAECGNRARGERFPRARARGAALARRARVVVHRSRDRRARGQRPARSHRRLSRDVPLPAPHRHRVARLPAAGSGRRLRRHGRARVASAVPGNPGAVAPARRRAALGRARLGATAWRSCACGTAAGLEPTRTRRSPVAGAARADAAADRAAVGAARRCGAEPVDRRGRRRDVRPGAGSACSRRRRGTRRSGWSAARSTSFTRSARRPSSKRAAARSRRTRSRASKWRCHGRRCHVRSDVFRAAGDRLRAAWFALPDLFEDGAGMLTEVIEAAAMTAASPIVTVNLWFDRPVTRRTFVGLPGRAMQWVFDKRALFGEGTSHLSLVSSGATAIVGRSNEELVDLALDELRAALPSAREAERAPRSRRAREAGDVLGGAGSAAPAGTPDGRSRAVPGGRLDRDRPARYDRKRRGQRPRCRRCGRRFPSVGSRESASEPFTPIVL